MDTRKTEGVVEPAPEAHLRKLMEACGEDLLAELGAVSDGLGRSVTLLITLTPNNEDADVTLRFHPLTA